MPKVNFRTHEKKVFPNPVTPVVITQEMMNEEYSKLKQEKPSRLPIGPGLRPSPIRRLPKKS